MLRKKCLYLPTNLLFQMLCIPLYRIRFSSSVKTEGLHLTFLGVQVFWWWILSAFVYLKKFLFCFHFERYIYWVNKSRLTFFHYFKDLVLMSSGLHHFQWKIFCPLYVMCLFSPFWLHLRFSVSLFLSNLIIMCLSVIFLLILVPGVCCSY